eukprot:COSAG01_NODE_5543_length_4195_cov_1.542725_3_plen_178_part_00
MLCLHSWPCGGVVERARSITRVPASASQTLSHFQDIIEARWLVNGGHGAGQRQLSVISSVLLRTVMARRRHLGKTPPVFVRAARRPPATQAVGAAVWPRRSAVVQPHRRPPSCAAAATAVCGGRGAGGVVQVASHAGAEHERKAHVADADDDLAAAPGHQRTRCTRVSGALCTIDLS